MTLGVTGQRTFVGFGFGAIQAGLFLYEAFRSDNFGRLMVSEVVPDVVHAVRAAGGRFFVNIAHSDHLEVAEVGPLEIQDPGSESDRRRLVEAVAEAEEIATAVPSVQFSLLLIPGAYRAFWLRGCDARQPRRGHRQSFTQLKTITMRRRSWKQEFLKRFPKRKESVCALASDF